MSEEFSDLPSQRNEPIMPTQGKRLSKEILPFGDVVFTIRGQGFPGFLDLFGLIFGGIPSLIVLSMLFYSSTSEKESSYQPGILLLLLGCIVSWLGNIIRDLFLWWGVSKLNIGQKSLHIDRRLLGIRFWQRKISRSSLGITFEESHRKNDVPFYKLSFTEGSKHVGIGNSFKDAELLWLARELKTALGLEASGSMDVAEAMRKQIMAVIPNPEFRSKYLRITRTPDGWQSQSQLTFFQSLGISVIGVISLAICLLMFFDFPTSRFKLSFGDMLSIVMAFCFGLIGVFAFLLGVFLLGYRLTISRIHAQLKVVRSWAIFPTSQIYEISDLVDLQLKSIGHASNAFLYQLTGVFRDGQKVRLIYFAPNIVVGQILAHLRADIKNIL